MAGWGHFRKFNLICFRKFSWVSTRKPFHCGSISQPGPCFCSGALSRSQARPGRSAFVLFASPPYPARGPPHLPASFLSTPFWLWRPSWAWSLWPSSLSSDPLPSKPPCAQPSLTIFPSHPLGPTQSLLTSPCCPASLHIPLLGPFCPASLHLVGRN